MENSSTELKKKDEQELREYEKRSLALRATVALGTMILSGLAGYLTGGRLKRR